MSGGQGFVVQRGAHRENRAGRVEQHVQRPGQRPESAWCGSPEELSTGEGRREDNELTTVKLSGVKKQRVKRKYNLKKNKI